MSGGGEPLVSVVIPMRDAREFVGEAIASVLAQSHGELEVLVVDDGSSDDSPTIAKASGDTRVQVIEQQPSGAAAARNRGVAEASGSHLAFLDADDRWTPDKLSLQLAVLEARVGVEMVFGHSVEIGEDGTRLPGEGPRPAYSPCSMLIRRADFDRVGGFETALPVGEFIDWFARAEDAELDHEMLPDVVMERRVHSSNATRSDEARDGYAQVVRNVAARRGQARNSPR